MEEILGCGGCGKFENIDRRAFLSKSALAAVSLALAACAAGGDATGPAVNLGPSGSATIKVSDYSALSSVGGIATFDVSGTPVAVVRTGASTFLALSRICPHQGGTIGKFGSGFMCPVHGAQFSSTGQWAGGQRTSNMQTIASSYDAANGTLTIG